LGGKRFLKLMSGRFIVENI
jgi:hypothetical protein